MPNKFTENYNLNQWEPGDPVLHTDFNADNLKIDKALKTLDTSLNTSLKTLSTSLDTSLSFLTTSLAGKIGRSRITETRESDGVTTAPGFGFGSPVRTWSDWEYVCTVVQYPGMGAESTPLSLTIFDKTTQSVKVMPLALPGYLVVFLPRHDGTQPAAGFVISDRFFPFSCPFSFNAIIQIDYSTQNGTYLIQPNIVTFAGG